MSRKAVLCLELIRNLNSLVYSECKISGSNNQVPQHPGESKPKLHSSNWVATTTK